MRRRALLGWLSASLPLAVSGGFPLVSGPSSVDAASTIANADWPQLGRDPQRSNASPQSVTGPYRFYWRWTNVPIASRAQPVTVNGTLFIGGLDGVMYALNAAYDARGGNPQIVWQQNLGSPIRAGAGVDTSNGTVIVGSHQGTIYGLNSASGQTLWTATTSGAILSAPLIANGAAYLGSADGSFYAIRTSDGTVLWQQPIGAPILGSAALSSDGSAVFFLAENVVAYALSTSNGSILWQTQLQGQSSADRWPVVLGSQVIFRTQAILNFSTLLQIGDSVLDSAGAILQDWSADWALIRPAIIQHLASNAPEQTFFALNTTTGQSLGTAPILYTYGDANAASPPTIYNGAYYLPYRPRHGIQNDGGSVHVTTKYDAELGKLDPTSLDITGLTSPSTFSYQFRLTSDEPSILTVAGDLLLVDNWERLGGISLSTGALVGLAEVAYSSTCWNGWGANNASIPFFDNCSFPPNGGEGNARCGATVASGRVFWHVETQGAFGLGAIGPANGISTPAMPGSSPPSAAGPLPAATPVSTQTLTNYVWTEPSRPVSVPADLQQRLQQEIGRIVAANNHLLPYYIERGDHGLGSWPPDVSGNNTEPAIVANNCAFWYDPGELIYTLSIAYPYLNSTLQAQLKSYLQAEMNRYPPLQGLPYNSSWLTQGVAREPYPVPIRATNSNMWPPPGAPIQTLYALWAYGRYTGDWAYLSSQWSNVQSLFYAKSNSIDSYAEIAGAIGYARIAKQLGNTSEANAGAAAAVSAMQTGYNFAQWLSSANSLYAPFQPAYAQLEKPGRRAPVFFGLTPEVGQYLHDTNVAAVQYTVNDVTGFPSGTYLWYATRVGLQGELSESSYHFPDIAWSIFLTQAYALQQNQAQLRYWLDRPWGLGDVWYLQKLIATMEAPGAAAYSSTLQVVK